MSSGDGVLREVVYSAFLKFLSGPGRQFLVPRTDEKLSLLFITSIGFGSHSAGSRQRIIATAGALWALMLIKGFSVDPIDPALIQFLFNEGDFHSLHRAFIGEHHPELQYTIDFWKAAGPTGDINRPDIVSHFATYHNLEVRIYSLCFSRTSQN